MQEINKIFLSLRTNIFQDFYGSHGAWACKLVLSDFMNLVNLILNIVFMQWYLGGHFIHYGIQFISYQLAEVRLLGKKIFLVCLNIFLSKYIFQARTRCTLYSRS